MPVAILLSSFLVSAAKEPQPRKTAAPAKPKQAQKNATSPASKAAPSASRKIESRDVVAPTKKAQPGLQPNLASRKSRDTKVLRPASSGPRSDEVTFREDVQAMIAKDDLRGEDPEVRRVALTALGNHAGTVVVMDPKNGRIYSIVNQEWALHEGFKPCSTIKLVTGLAGLSEGVIDSDESTDGSSGNTNLTRALAYSRNGYFQHVGSQVGYDAMLSYARKLGLGEKTGINMRNESAGRLPDLTARPGIARMSSHGDEFEVTALQLATLVSAIGNGGRLVSPYVVRSRQDESKFRTKVRRQINLDSAWQNILPGMVGAVNYGSGNKAHDPRQTVAGKTGTCIEDGQWVGLFTSFAPLSNPRLSVVVITRGADARNHVPAAIAGQIYRGLDERFGSSGKLQVATNRKAAPTYEVSNQPRFSDEDRNVMGNLTSLKRPQVESIKPAMMQIRSKAVPTTKVTSDVTSPVISPDGDGQSRPRRVYGN